MTRINSPKYEEDRWFKHNGDSVWNNILFVGTIVCTDLIKSFILIIIILRVSRITTSRGAIACKRLSAGMNGEVQSSACQFVILLSKTAGEAHGQYTQTTREDLYSYLYAPL